ncbi:MAG: DUF6338 family protein [Gemmatimonadetes bacterium]|nr:DUF6338 family protein [Gemmatimonadota bacterium]
MPDLANNTIDVLNFLVPGFVAAGIYYALTAAPKPNTFERIIQALIFTVVIKAITTVGTTYGPLNDETWLAIGPIGTIAMGIVLGFGFAVLVNWDIPHRWFRQWGMTRETAYPSDWYTVFATWEGRLVVLHLRNGRRIYGWPKQWPGPEDARLFVIENPQWLGEGESVSAGEALTVRAEDVEMVQFVSPLPDPPQEEPEDG